MPQRFSTGCRRVRPDDAVRIVEEGHGRSACVYEPGADGDERRGAVRGHFDVSLPLVEVCDGRGHGVDRTEVAAEQTSRGALPGDTRCAPARMFPARTAVSRYDHGLHLTTRRRRTSARGE